MSVLQDSVLVLNKNWQAIDVTDVETAFCNVTREVCTPIDTDSMRAVSLAEWMKLPVLAHHRSIGTIHGQVRVPTVIAAVHYDKMPKKAPKLCAKNIEKRDKGRCQYSNRLLKPGEGNLDHVISRARGGKDTWENLVWSDKEINQVKADKSPEEVGLKLVKKPKAPATVPAMLLIEPRPDKPDWNKFLITT